jgi:hypothetical protein
MGATTMTDDSTSASAPQGPHPSLRTLDRLVGTWAVSGPGLQGTVRYEWMAGGGFLVQHVDLVHDDETTRGVEYIGYDRETGTLRSHYFGGDGELLEYTYDLTGDTLTIWFGGADSPARFTGTFSDDGTRNTGAWQWPGGGYESNMTRVEG